jgi:glycosyltransferase involved in cell wall biosynthesis
MKIAIVNAMVPFIYGGAEFHVKSLNDKLIEFGYDAQIIRFPFSWWPVNNIIDGIMAARLTKLDNIDMMIGFKFPTYLIPHENKKVWLIHQFRQAYDLEGTEHDFFTLHGSYTPDKHAQEIKQTIINVDNYYLKQLEGKIFTNSYITYDRLKKFNGIESEVLFPPLVNEEMFYYEKTGDYIFYPSRVDHLKRQYLAVEAMQYTKSKVKLLLAGKGGCKNDEDEIFQLIEKYNISDKVTYRNRFISEKEKYDFYASCLGVAFIPHNEDYGYITAEAFKSSKPVITCFDSGCPALIVQHEQSGYIVNPTAQELAAAMDMLYENSKYAVEMGQNAKERLKELNINWETVITRLVK